MSDYTPLAVLRVRVGARPDHRAELLRHLRSFPRAALRQSNEHLFRGAAA